MDVDTNKKLSDKISEKQDIVNQFCEGEKLGTLINNTSQSSGGMDDTQQGFYESDDDFFNSTRSNDETQLKMLDVQEETLHHSVVELFPDGIFVLDLKGIIKSCNASAVTLLGYSKEELIGHKFSDMGKYDEKGIATYLNIFDSIIQGNKVNPFELKLQKKDGTLFTVEMRVRLLTQNGKKFGIQLIARKISDIKIQEEKNKVSKDSFQRIFSLIPDMISVHDKEMNIIYSNWKGFAAIPEEKRILNTKCYKTYRGLDHICPDCKAGIVLNTKESIQEELELPEGIWVDLRVLPLIDENNDVELFVEWVRNISKRKGTEKALLESEKKHRRLFETMAQGVIYQNADGTIISANPAAERILGHTFEQMQGKTSMDPCWQMIKEDGTAVPGTDHPSMVALQTGQSIGPVTRGIYQPDVDSHIWLRITAIPLFQPGETKPFQAYAVFEDITELKKNKKRLEQIQWMLSEKEVKNENIAREYGDLTELNKNGLILSTVGKKQLMQMTSEYLDLLETSSAVYEKNGDYAVGLFSSSWCQMMDAASRKLCRTDNNKEALSCGKWLCHESCWRASMKSIESGSPVDVKCNGGIHLYAVPILVSGEVIGAINFGHGNPPDDDSELQKLSDLYQIPIEKMRKARQEYQVRPQFIIDHAKKRIQVSAKHIGSLVERKQAEEKLRESESQVRDLVNNTPDFIYSLNRERRHTAVNRSVCAAMDIEAYEIIDKNHSELGFPEDICREWHKLHDKVFSTKQVVKTETATFMPDGTEHTYEVVLTPIFDENENVNGIRGISRDITKSKQAVESLKQSEKKYRTYIDHAPNAVFLCDEKGRYLEVNGKASEITGYSKDELLRMSIADITADEDKETAMNHFITLKERNYSSGELLFTHKNGSKHWWSVDAVKLSENRFLGFSVDITERKQAEENLKQMHRVVQELNKSLEKKVVQRTERIKQLLNQKDEFINQLGHDLKNPLGPFMQLLPILENHISDEKDKRMIKVLSRNAKYMRNLVKKTIDLAQLNSSKTMFTFEDVSLSDIVDEVVEGNASFFDEYDVVVENNVSTDSLVHVDPLHLQEVFTNLFNNAVKYSEDKKWIAVDAVEKDDHVLVSVKDTGIGISEEQLPYLFDEYYKADSSRHDFDSSGLGLPICKRIIEKHGGSIWAESPGIGKGSMFYFTLPKKGN